jgi:beta-glucosidase-like glycosyl hydrolase
MSNWRIVDVDHFMKGNSFFNKLVTDVDWHKDVEAHIGTPDKRNKVIKEPDQVNEVRELLNLYENYINMKEPRSNRGLEDFKSKEELEAEKQAAKERAQLKQAEAAAAKKKKEAAAAGESA